VTGIGATYPDDTYFVASQCPSSVIDPSDYFNAVSNNSDYGLSFTTPFVETYDISKDLSETIPGDFETLRIDAHLGYYDSLYPEITDITPYANVVYTNFQPLAAVTFEMKRVQQAQN